MSSCSRNITALLLCLLCFFDLLFVTDSATDTTDVTALKAFLKKIEDPAGTLQNWIGEDPCGQQWEGVICSPPIDGTSRVTELRLLNHNLSGYLDPELGNLEGLQILDLMWNQISGPIPKELGKLKQLALLLLNGNNLSGTIPVELGELHLLDRFQIDSNHITGPIPVSFQNLVSMKHIHMNNNSLTGSIPKELGKLPKLVHLLVDTNKLDGMIPSELAKISTLQILQLDNNPFTGASIPQEFASMANLTKLSMRNCNLRGTIPDLSHMLKLEYLDLSENQLEGEIPSKVNVNLTTVDLSSNFLNGSIPDQFGTLPKLQLLALRNNKLSGPIPASFGTGGYFTNSNGEILLDFRNNSLSAIPSNLTNAIKYRTNLYVWLHDNHDICSTNDTLIHHLCKSHRDIFFSESKEEDSSYSPSCDPMTCSPGEEPIPSIFYTQGLCRCATPIIVGYRLKSPSFSFFTPFIKGYEQWIASGLKLSEGQVHLDSFTKEPGPRFATVLKIFPTQGGQRVFSRTEVMRIFSVFSAWKMPPNEFYGPQELMFFNYKVFHAQIGALSAYHHGWRFLLVVVLSSMLCTAVIVGALVFLLLRNGRLRSKLLGSRATVFSVKSGSRRRMLKVTGVKEFTFHELSTATKDFDDEMLVGHGGYGRVYKGVLRDGQVVAIKRVKEGSLQGEEEFQTEVELLSRLHHRNLVSLLGYCIYHKEQILIYEFMPNGTLKDHLSGCSTSSRGSILNFADRLRIAIGAARGIHYLHVEANPPIFHRDIKASNILLDAHNSAKVADFGLSKLAPTLEHEGDTPGYVSTVVKGTPGYLDPEYFLTHKLTDKSDVYSFGVVLLELITSMQPIANGKNIVREVKQAFENGTLLGIVDEKMGSYPIEALAPLVRLALSCCNDDPTMRPSMNEVVRGLEGIWHSVPWPESIRILDQNSTSFEYSNEVCQKKDHSTKNLYFNSGEDSSEIYDPHFQANVAPR